MNYLITFLSCLLLPVVAIAETRVDSAHAQKALEIYTRILAMETSKGLGNTPGMAHYLRDELLAAGFPGEDVEVISMAGTAAFIARYRGDGSSGRRPILLLAHMDVVEANPEDWERPPFELTRDDEFFYARGAKDNKLGIAQLTATFVRLKKEGFVPNRDLILAFSGDEESGMVTTRFLASGRGDLAEAEFALNSDSGGGELDDRGRALGYGVQVAEKTYATWELTVRNPGGHSSRPRPDNAIYDLADAISRIQAFQFPVRWNDMTLAYLQHTGELLDGELGEAMLRFAANPRDKGAADRLALESAYVGTTRTTCVVTMLRAGHAENALPQSATATVNCRIFPGTSAEEVRSTLATVVANGEVEFRQIGPPIVESPVSDFRDDVRAAVSKAVHERYPDVAVIPYMASGGTDGMHFRKAGIPTLAVSSTFIRPSDDFAHGLNERLPIESFYGALDHWSIILRELAGDGWPAKN